MKNPSKTSESEKNTGATKVQLDQFKRLLEQLESSKMRQQRQRSVEGRRDIYSQGLASMMSNF